MGMLYKFRWRKRNGSGLAGPAWHLSYVHCAIDPTGVSSVAQCRLGLGGRRAGMRKQAQSNHSSGVIFCLGKADHARTGYRYRRHERRPHYQPCLIRWATGADPYSLSAAHVPCSHPVGQPSSPQDPAHPKKAQVPTHFRRAIQVECGNHLRFVACSMSGCVGRAAATCHHRTDSR